jgi:hypothetical protein
LEQIEAQERHAEVPAEVLVEAVNQMLREREIGTIADDVEETDKYGELDEQRQAALEWIDLVLFPELHGFFLQCFLIVLVPCAKRFDFGLQHLHFFLAFERVLRGDEQQQFDDERQDDDGDTQVVTGRDASHEDQEVQERCADERAEKFGEKSGFGDRELRRRGVGCCGPG